LSLVKTIKTKFLIIGTHSYANSDAIFLRIAIKQKIKALVPSPLKKMNSLIEIDNNHLRYGPRNIYFDKNQKKKFNDIKLS
jgi:hypothetical protein